MSDQSGASVEPADVVERVAQEIFDNIVWGEFYRFGDALPDTTCAARAAIAAIAAITAPDLRAVRDDADLLREANELARSFSVTIGYDSPVGYRFDRSNNPRARKCWEMVKLAYEFLTMTDLHDVEGEDYADLERTDHAKPGT